MRSAGSRAGAAAAHRRLSSKQRKRCLRCVKVGNSQKIQTQKDRVMNSDNDNSSGSARPEDEEDKPSIFIIIGQTSKRKGGEMRPVHVLIAAPDDDTAVRLCLDALSAKGFAEADLDQIGVLEDMPDEEPHASAYQGAMEGEVAVIAFE